MRPPHPSELQALTQEVPNHGDHSNQHRFTEARALSVTHTPTYSKGQCQPGQGPEGIGSWLALPRRAHWARQSWVTRTGPFLEASSLVLSPQSLWTDASMSGSQGVVPGPAAMTAPGKRDASIGRLHPGLPQGEI